MHNRIKNLLAFCELVFFNKHTRSFLFINQWAKKLYLLHIVVCVNLSGAYSMQFLLPGGISCDWSYSTFFFIPPDTFSRADIGSDKQ